MLPTPNHYWRLFNYLGLAPLDPGLSPITSGLGHPLMTTEAFLGLTQQVRALTGKIQAIVPYIPQLAQAPTHQHPHVPRQAVREETPQSRPPQGEHPEGAPRPPAEAAIKNSNVSMSQSPNRSRDVMRLPPEPEVVISPKDNLSGHPEEGIGRSYWPPSLSRSYSIQPELRRYCRFHRDYDHDIDECNNLRNQIEDLIRQGISIASSEIDAPPGNASSGQEPLSSTGSTS
ncbi:hypothetical protein B296_00022342 [Ensete ventricosum]|uniref:Uncharacterized protein n=1 Tax=Ensete ventricosum TaxID=4639 RepID=A0A426XMG2_ENSVE|nr:hypothetical protein B296_00022342 [Ensete ventricosum]